MNNEIKKYVKTNKSNGVTTVHLEPKHQHFINKYNLNASKILRDRIEELIKLEVKK